MRFLLLAAVILSSQGLYAASKGALENPQPGNFASGIYLISGWVCDAERVEVLLDGSQYVEAAYGSERVDTVSVCGDSDNGFGVLVNMANIGAGEHQVALIADGDVIATHDFQVAALSTGEFAQNLEGCAVSEGFPREGAETSLQWTTSMQGFLITGEGDSSSESLEGPWTAGLWQAQTWVYREGCGPKNLFMFARMETPGGDVGYLRMAGGLDAAPYHLKSTDLDPVDREATLTIVDDNTIQLDFTSCEAKTTLCDFTPAGGRVILDRVPTLLGPTNVAGDD